MSKVKVSDKVFLKQTSYAFGIIDGLYVCGSGEVFYKGQKFTVIAHDLCVARKTLCGRIGEDGEVCDLLITDGNENYLFIKSEYVKSVNPEPTHTVVFDGNEPVELSDKSFKALKKALGNN